jgi:hypothetical protein
LEPARRVRAALRRGWSSSFGAGSGAVSAGSAAGSAAAADAVSVASDLVDLVVDQVDLVDLVAFERVAGSFAAGSEVAGSVVAGSVAAGSVATPVAAGSALARRVRVAFFRTGGSSPGAASVAGPSGSTISSSEPAAEEVGRVARRDRFLGGEDCSASASAIGAAASGVADAVCGLCSGTAASAGAGATCVRASTRAGRVMPKVSVAAGDAGVVGAAVCRVARRRRFGALSP